MKEIRDNARKIARQPASALVRYSIWAGGVRRQMPTEVRPRDTQQTLWQQELQRARPNSC